MPITVKVNIHVRSNGLNDATLDENIIREWWTKWPDANIGIDCRRSGIFVIDNDVRKGGFASHSDLKEYVTKNHGPMPETCTVLTGSNDGSTHDIYKRIWAEGETALKDLDKAHGLELRGAGNYIVGAPSRHVSGGTYRVDGIEGANALLKLTPGQQWLNKCVRNGATLHTEDPTANADQPQKEKTSSFWVNPKGGFKFWPFCYTHLKLIGLPETTSEGIRQKVRCPWFKEHTKGEDFAQVIECHDGRCGFHCWHSHCADRRWSDVRALYDPDYRAWKEAHADSEEESPPQAEAPNEWLDPEPIAALPDIVPFDLDLLPPLLQPVVQDIARRMQLPLELPAVGIVATLMGAVNRRAQIQPNDCDSAWVEVLNLWAMLIAPPGVGKSPLIQLCIAALLAIEKDWRQDFETKLAEYVCQQEEHKLQKDLWAQQYKAAHKEGKTAPERPSDLTAAPVLKRIITNDASYEKLHAVMRKPRGSTAGKR